MRFTRCLLITVALSTASTAQPVVEVFIPPVTATNMNTPLLRAKMIVAEIYSTIGVRVVWSSAHSAPSGCEKNPLHGKIVVAFRTGASAGRSDAALAFSNPYSHEGPCVTVLMDRLKPEGEKNMLRVGFVLGHVLAHEIGHVLEGVPRHSETGLMKARWSDRETMNMPHQTLRFTAYDAELVLKGLAFQSILRAGEKGNKFPTAPNDASILVRQPVSGEEVALIRETRR